jgi:uncharacterized protein (TIGR02147 family)
MKSIFEFDDYRRFLRNWIENQPKKGRGILKVWSDLLRVEPSVMSQILAGKRDLNPDQVFELQVYMNLGELESEYFNQLVAIDRASTQKLKVHLRTKLNKLKKASLELTNRLKREFEFTDQQKAIFYSSWLYSALRLAISCSGDHNIDSLASKFGITRERAAEILQFLVSTGLVIEELGSFKMGPQRTHLERSSPFFIKNHNNWRIKAIQHSENLHSDELMFTGPLSISRKDFKFVREEAALFIERISQIVKDSKAEDVAVFQMDLFWLKAE